MQVPVRVAARPPALAVSCCCPDGRRIRFPRWCSATAMPSRRLEPARAPTVDGLDAPVFQPAVLRREGCGFRPQCRRSDRVHSHRLSLAVAAGLAAAFGLAASGERGGEAAGVGGEEKQPEVGVALVGRRSRRGRTRRRTAVRLEASPQQAQRCGRWTGSPTGSGFSG